MRLLSFSSQLEFNYTMAGTTIAFDNILSGNGLTIISPVQANVLLRRLSIYASSTPRNNTAGQNRGYQLNAFQVEFNLVDFGGQLIKIGDSFNNLFVSNPALSVVSVSPYDYAINEILPQKDFCVVGGGMYIKNIKFQVQGQDSGTINYTTKFVFTMDYEML